MGRWLTTLVLLEIVANGVAWACSCVPTTAEDAVRSGDPVVLATIERVRPWGCNGTPSRYLANVDVTEVLAGPGELGPQVVWTSTSEASCGLDLQPGDWWVLHVRDGSVGLCSASSWVEGPDDPWVQELRAAAAAAEGPSPSLAP